MMMTNMIRKITSHVRSKCFSNSFFIAASLLPFVLPSAKLSYFIYSEISGILKI